jgi:hypothetical protein
MKTIRIKVSTMCTRVFSKSLIAAAAFAALVMTGMLIASPYAGAQDNGSQDEKEMIRIGLAVAPVPLNMARKDKDMVGLGSYIVNVSAGCNGCHSNGPATQFLPTGNPYLRQPPFNGTTTVNPATYLGGGRDFGPFPGPQSPLHIISRNLTPDKSGLPEGGHTLAEFIQIIRTGVDMDHAHPNCPTNAPNCMPPPFDGNKLQIMPWPDFRLMTDRQLRAIYSYLGAIPCLEGGPGEPFPRCY